MSTLSRVQEIQYKLIMYIADKFHIYKVYINYLEIYGQSLNIQCVRNIFLYLQIGNIPSKIAFYVAVKALDLSKLSVIISLLEYKNSNYAQQNKLFVAAQNLQNLCLNLKIYISNCGDLQDKQILGVNQHFYTSILQTFRESTYWV